MERTMTHVLRIYPAIVLGLLLFTSGLFADISTPSSAGYAWADSQDVEFGWIEISDGTELAGPGVDDAVFTVNLPFTFEFYSQSYTTLYVSSNGYLTFTDYGTNSFPSNDALPPNIAPNPLIALFWDNLNVPNGQSARIFSKTVGTAPYRKHIIEYRNMEINLGGGGPLTFQAMLYETTNLVKIQYLDLGGLSNAEIGRNATVGIRNNADVLPYSVDTAALSEQLAILFFPLSNLSATGSVVPTTVSAGTTARKFRLNTTSLAATASFSSNGKADVLRIANPFPSDISIIDTINVDGNDFFFIQRNSAPTVGEYNFFPNLATWFYDVVDDSLFIRLPPLSIRDNVAVSFRADAPTTAGSTTVNYNVYNALNPVGSAAMAPQFTTTGSSAVASYTITPATPASVLAGAPQSLTITALDQFDVPIANNETVSLQALGSSTAGFSQNPVSFGGASSVNVNVTDNVVGQFNVRAFDITDSNKDAVSAAITVLPAAPAALQILSSSGAIEVGTTRQLRVQLLDAFGNVHPDSSVSFQILTGDAQFTTGGTLTSDLTDAGGVAEVGFRASTSVGTGSDQISVSFGGINQTITLPLQSGGINYFELNFIGSSTVVAAQQVTIEVTARDAFGNAVVNSETYNASAIGSSTASFLPSSTYTFSNRSTDTLRVLDTTAGTFSARAALVSNSSRNGTSDAITVTPSVLAELRLRDQAGNTGRNLGGVDTTISSTSTLVLYAAGYDVFGNYIGEVATTQWSVFSGSLLPSPPLTFPATAGSINFSPAGTSSGVLSLSIPGNPGVGVELSGSITVNAGSLSFVRIQSDPDAVGSEIGDVPTLSTGDTLRMYAVGYDNDNNRIGTVNSNWSVSPTSLGEFGNGQPTQNGVTTVLFTATAAGSGIVRSEAVSNTAIFDQTGVLTVSAGAVTSVLIRSAANNGGFAYNATPQNITTDNSLTLFAAGYDAFGNYVGDVVVSWAGTGLTGVPAGPATSITFNPTAVQTGTIRTIAGGAIVNDTTATITVTVGALARLVVQDGPTGAASEIDTTTLVAGSNLALFAAGYDADGNFISLISSNWTLEGTSIGIFSNGNPSTGNTLQGRTAGLGRVRAVQNAGSFSDVTSSITVIAGAPAILAKIATSDNQIAPVNTELPRDIEVLVQDAFSNPVSGVTITYIPLAGGTVNPPTAITNIQGIAASRWTVHGTSTPDSLGATYAGGVTLPDTVVFNASVSAGGAASLASVGAVTGSGAVDTDLGNLFTVEVRDGGNNPVPGVQVSFAIISQPAGAANAALTTTLITTNASGQASTLLHLGTLLGDYVVQAATAITSPTFVNFTGTANLAGTADNVLVVSGDGQSGTVGQILANSLVFRVTDGFGNAVAGEGLTFAASGGGSPIPASGTTNGAGEVSLSWDLGNIAGSQQLTATLTSNPLRTAVATATGLPGFLDDIHLVSMRQIPVTDFIAAVPGENITVIVMAHDPFDNPIANVVLDYNALPGFDLIFESAQVTTGSDGSAINVVKTDANNTESIFEVSSGAEVRQLHIRHLLYVANSLSPSSVSPDSSISFQLQVQNTAPNDVDLDPANTLFSFSDGTSSFSAALTGPVTLTASSNTTLTFAETLVDGNFASAGYAPILQLNGSGVNDALSGQIVLPSSSLNLFKSQITGIVAGNTIYSRGNTFDAFMTIDNSGPDTVLINTVGLSISGFPPTAIVPLAGNPVQMLPNTPNNQFGFQVTVPGGANLGFYTIDGQFSGTTTTGTVISDGQATNTWTFEVIQNASLSVLTFSPSSVTSGDVFSFQASVLNSGGLTTVLDAATTLMMFGSDSYPLVQSSSVPPGSGPQDAVMLTFQAGAITSPASLTAYPVQMAFSGSENGVPFDTTVSVPTPLMLVQNPPDVDVAFLDVLQDNLSQGSDSVQVSLVLNNTSANGAVAIVSRPDSIRLSTLNGGLAGIFPVSNDNSLFPLSIAAGATSDTIHFVFPLSTVYPLGVETVRVSYGFSDSNSGRGQSVSPSPVTATFTVVSPPDVVLVSGSSAITPSTATAGQTGVDFRFTLRNNGEAPALLNSGAIAVEFNNPHTITPVSPALPLVLNANTTQEFIYSVDVAANSSIGNDPVDLTIAYSDELSGKSFSTAMPNADTLQIITPADSSLLQIQSVQITPVNVTQGQTGIGANVRLRNLSQSAVLLNSLNLAFDRPGITTILNTPPGLIPPGNVALYNFTLSVGAAMTPGVVAVDAAYIATDQTSGTTFADSGAVVPDAITVLTPAAFSFAAISITPATVGEGQTGIAVRTTLTNTGQSPVQLSSLTPSFDNGAGDISAVLVSPIPAPELPGGGSVAVEYSLSIGSPSSYLGPVAMSIAASGVDLTDAAAVNGLSATPGVFNIVQRAELRVADIVVEPDSAYLGQENILVTVRATNIGQGPAVLNSSMLMLVNNNFPLVQQTTGFPFSLAQGDTQDVVYLLDVPDNIVLTDVDSTIYHSARLDGSDVTTGTTLSTTRDSVATLTVVQPAVVVFEILLSAQSYNTGEQARIIARISNTGGAPLLLNGATILRLQKNDDPQINVSLPIDLLTSELVLNPGDTITVESQDQALTLAGTFRLFVDVAGTAFGSDFSQQVNSLVNINVGGDIFVSQLTVSPVDVSPGEIGVELRIQVQNNSLPASVESAQLAFSFVDNGEPLLLSATRIDVVDSIPQFPQTAIFIWQFDIPIVRTGEIRAQASFVLNGGAQQLNYVDPGVSFTIVSGIEIAYVDGSLTPATVVNGEQVNFRARFVNSGNTTLIVDPDNSDISFSDGLRNYNAIVDGNFTIRGTQDSIPDTSAITYVLTQVDANFSSGIFPAAFSLRGTLPNGDSFSGYDTTVSAVLTVLPDAEVLVDNINVVPTDVNRGQTGVQIAYTLRNSGGSAANVSSLSSLFEDSNGADVSLSWQPTGTLPVLPQQIAPGGSATITRTFTVLESAPLDTVKAFLSGVFNDVRKPLQPDTFADTTNGDSVTVSTRAGLAFSGAISAPAGALDAQVSTHQRFVWSLSLNRLPGTGALVEEDSSSILLDFTNKGFFFDSQLTIQNRTVRVFPDSMVDVEIWAGASPRFASLTAVVTDTSNDASSGEPALLNTNTLTQAALIVNRAAVQLDLTGPTLVDTSSFEIRAVITNTGVAGLLPNQIEVTLDASNAPGISLLSPATLMVPLNQNGGMRGEGLFLFDALTESAANKLVASILQDVASDSNSNETAFHVNDTDSLLIDVVTEAIAISNVRISSPAGAVDGIVSSGQDFNISADYLFNPSIIDTSSIQARIVVPAGYDGGNGSIFNTLPSRTGTINWRISAPADATPVNNLRVEFRGKRSAGSDTVTVSSSLAVTTVNRAELSVDAVILDPEGARDGVLSTLQYADMSVSVINSGTAATTPGLLNRVRTTLPTGYRLVTLDDSLRFIATGATDTIRVQAPALASGASANVVVMLDQAAPDENTGLPAVIIDQSDNLGVITVARAALVIELEAAASVSANQTDIPVTVRVTNNGTAQIEPDSVEIRLAVDSDTLLQINGGQEATRFVKLVQGTGSTTILMQAVGDTGNAQLTASLIDVTAQDENNNYPDTLAFVQTASTGQTVAVGSGAAVQVLNAAILAPQGAVDNVLSSGQSFVLRAKGQYTGSVLAEDRIAQLLLPAGFLADSLTKIVDADTSVRWNILAPLSLSGAPKGGAGSEEKRIDEKPGSKTNAATYTVEVVFRGEDQNNPGVIVRDTLEYPMEVVPAANLSLTSGITAGAVNNRISFGQEFTFSATVQNLGDAGIAASPQSLLSLELGDSLILVQGEAQQAYQPDVPVEWVLQAETSSALGKIQRDIDATIAARGQLLARMANSKQADEGGSSPAKRQDEQEERELQQKLQLLYTEAGKLATDSYIKVSIDPLPFDENSGAPVILSNGSDSLALLIEAQPEISVLSLQAPSTVSSAQTFNVIVTVETPENVIDRTALLRLPPGFNFSSPGDSTRTFSGLTTQWPVVAPANIPGGSSSGIIKVLVNGTDRNNIALTVKDSLTTNISAQNRAELDLRSISAQNVFQLAQDQTFQISTVVKNTGAADVNGSGEVILSVVSPEFQFANGSVARQAFTIDNAIDSAIVSWTLKAPADTNVNTQIGVGFTALPVDNNTNGTVAVRNDSLTFFVNMIASRVFVAKIDVERQNSYLSGDANVPAFGLEFSNPAPSDITLIRSLDLSFRDGPDNEPLSDPETLISKVRVVSEDYFNGLGKTPVDIYGEVDVTSASANPLRLDFSIADTVQGLVPERLIVLIDLASNAGSRKFSMRVDNVTAEQQQGSFFANVEVIDRNLGSPIDRIPLEFQSDPITIVSEDRETLFRNYPNPFGQTTEFGSGAAGSGFTRFKFWMESSGTAQLSIYTLLGRLVLRTDPINLPRGLSDGDLVWNGLNGQGRQVVNGVYVAVLRQQLSGQSNELKTKVVYIK